MSVIPFILLSGFIFPSQIFICVFFGMNVCVGWNLVVSVIYLAFVVDRLFLKSPVYLGWSGWVSMFVQLFGVALGMDAA